MMTLDSKKNDFPALSQKVFNYPLVYLDSAATSLKPKIVIDRIQQFNSYETANVHRGAHFLSDQATEMYEAARTRISKFIDANSANEIIFTRGTTESINLVANSISTLFNEGDEILLTEMEHHSNIVPWQMVAEKAKLKIKVIPVLQNGDLDYSSLDSLITDRTRMVAVTHCSNHLATINNIKLIIDLAHKKNAYVLVDGAQFIGKHPLSVKDLDVDFYVFSGHKIFAPFGIGILYGKEYILNKMPPYQGGGSMINQVSFEKTTYLEAPSKFEAGTPNVEGAIALGTALDYIEGLGWNWIQSHEQKLIDCSFELLKKVPNLQLIGEAKHRSALFSFVIPDFHHSDICNILNQQGIAVRAGHHCTQPLIKKFKITGSVRASFSVYNDTDDIEQLIKSLNKAREILL
jgi:cysteine desulfurase/selenocysteine lyase